MLEFEFFQEYPETMILSDSYNPVDTIVCPSHFPLTECICRQRVGTSPREVWQVPFSCMITKKTVYLPD